MRLTKDISVFRFLFRSLIRETVSYVFITDIVLYCIVLFYQRSVIGRVILCYLYCIVLSSHAPQRWVSILLTCTIWVKRNSKLHPVYEGNKANSVSVYLSVYLHIIYLQATLVSCSHLVQLWWYERRIILTDNSGSSTGAL